MTTTNTNTERKSTGKARANAIQPPALAIDRAAAAAACGVGMSTFQAMVQRGDLPRPRQLNGCARWLVVELQASLAALPQADLLPPPKTRSN